MDEEVSMSIRIGVLFIMIGAFLSAVLNIAIQSNMLLDNEVNRYADARTAVGSSVIVDLQNHPRSYFDLVRVIHEQEELVNSVILESADGSEFYILYLRSTAIVQNGHSLIAIDNKSIPLNSLVKIDNVDQNLDSADHKKLVEIRENGTRCFLHVYACKDGSSFDIYGELED